MAEMCPSCKGTGKVINKAVASDKKPKAYDKPKAVGTKVKPKAR